MASSTYSIELLNGLKQMKEVNLLFGALLV